MYPESFIRAMGVRYWRTVDWDSADKVHDFRNHVPAEIRKMWHNFNDKQKLAIVCWAQQLADDEEWD